RHSKRNPPRSKRPMAHLDRARGNATVLSSRSYEFLAGVSPLGSLAGRISSRQRRPARRQCNPLVANPCPYTRPSRLARRSPFRGSSRHGRIRRLGNRAKERPLRGFLFWLGPALPAMAWAEWRRRGEDSASLALLRFVRPVYPRAPEQNRRLHPAGRTFADPM